MKLIVKSLLVLLLLLICIGLILPTDFKAQRSITIQAHKNQIHQLVGDLRQWPNWTPWQRQDPSIRIKIDQPEGTGAHQSWQGDSGSGELTFTQTSADMGVEYTMLLDGFPATAGIRYIAQAKGTKVEWHMQGTMPVPVVGGYLALIADSLFIGPMFEDGLNQLKLEVEKNAP